jgi:hypothetical protein
VLWRLQLVALGDGEAEIIRVSVPGDPAVKQGEMVRVDGMTAQAWEMDGRSGMPGSRSYTVPFPDAGRRRGRVHAHNCDMPLLRRPSCNVEVGPGTNPTLRVSNDRCDPGPWLIGERDAVEVPALLVARGLGCSENQVATLMAVGERAWRRIVPLSSLVPLACQSSGSSSWSRNALT